MTVSSSADRATQREQITQVLERNAAKGEPVRVRIPFTLYDAEMNRGYQAIREAAWNLTLDGATTTPEIIEDLIATIGRCIVAIAQEGSIHVIERLERPA